MSALLPIAIAETPIGFAAPVEGRLRFTAADPRLAEIEGEVFDDAGAARRLAEAMLAAQETASGGGRAASHAFFALLYRPRDPRVEA